MKWVFQKMVAGDLGVLGRDHGRVVTLVLEVGRSGEEETERELTR